MPELDRPRVLLVTRNLPPLIGGMERLNWHMAEALSKRMDVRIVGPRGSGDQAPNGTTVREVPLRPLWKFLLFAQWRALREAWKWKPDYVLAGSGLTALAVWLAARVSRARAMAYVHGLDLTVSNLVYRFAWLPALRRMDCIIANSKPTAVLVENIGVTPERIGIVHPGVDMPASMPGEAQVEKFRKRHDLDDQPLLLSVGRLSKRKGLLEFVTECLPRIVIQRPQTVLVVVGDVPMNALSAKAQSPQSIQAAASRAGVSQNVRFLGSLTDEDLEMAYRSASVHVFPVREIPGDPEGFGMVAVEAAANGLATVAFATGGVVDAVQEGVSGHLVAAGDYAAFAIAVERVIDDENAGLSASCVEFARTFAWPNFGEKLCERMQELAPLRGMKGGGEHGA